jgi:acyl carrier protein
VIQLNELIGSVINVSPSKLTSKSGPETLAEWDSLAHIGIVTAIEQTYQVQLTMPEILSVKTIAELRNILENRGVTFVDEGNSA